MRKPPALQFELPPEPAWVWAGAALAFLTTLALTLWALLWVERIGALAASAERIALALTLALILATSVAAVVVRRMRAHGGWWLHFDGQQWHWAPAHQREREASGQVVAVLDMGGWMLLRARPVKGSSAWIAVSLARLQARAADAAAISALRAHVLGPEGAGL